MRGRALRGLIGALGLLAGAVGGGALERAVGGEAATSRGVAAAQEAPAQDAPTQEVARLEAPERIEVGDRARVTLRVDVAPDVPVLVTPRSEGAALEVVRGRLLRADAADAEARPLRFEVPVVARTAGGAVLRVHVASFVCEGERCEPLEAEATLQVRVERPR